MDHFDARIAELLLVKLGDEALDHARWQLAVQLVRGDQDGANVWSGILAAMAVLTQTQQEMGAKLH